MSDIKNDLKVCKYVCMHVVCAGVGVRACVHACVCVRACMCV